MDRTQLGEIIATKLSQAKNEIQEEFFNNKIRSFFIDDLLPEKFAESIYKSFPQPTELTLRNSLREQKYVTSQMNLYNPILEEIVFAFQDPKVVSIISEITKIETLVPDSLLYAGGLSVMGKNNFLNPHVDNSHDYHRKNYRVLNLLYYVSPDWQESFGGNLELWENGVKNQPKVIFSKFNRLVVMATNKTSWHSVSPINYDGLRCCVSNYYFSPKSIEANDYFHPTSYRGRPEQPLRDVVLVADSWVRNSIRKVFPKGLFKTFHIYKK